MNNETTASQPNSIGDDALQLAKEAMEAALASHAVMLLTCPPKYAWIENRVGEKLLKALMAIATYPLDSKLRAPAVQASATIQAAPTLAFSLYTAVNNMVAHIGMCGEIDARHDLVAKVMDELHKLDDGNVAQRVDDLVEKAFMPKDQATKLAVEEYCHKADDATIQEPVMVAEPVGDAFGRLRGLMLERRRVIVAGDQAAQQDVERQVIACITVLNATGKLAAPMVADPAGVVIGYHVTHGEFRHFSGAVVPAQSTLQKHAPSSGYYKDCADLVVTPLVAATVKAVPGEALDASEVEYVLDGYYRKNGKHFDKLRGCPNDCTLDSGWVAHYVAAPLADKTGGGE